MISFQDEGGEPGAAEALEAGLSELNELARQPRPQPTRRHARAVLVPLGQLLPHCSSDVLKDVSERVRESTQGFPEAWLVAVTEELKLACAEYVMSVDERYLGMSDYDFDYTSGARERLGSRLRASAALGYPIPAGMHQRIADADAIYAPYVERRSQGR